MFLATDHVAFDIDRKRLAVWADIRHLQWGFAQRRECGEMRQHGNPAEKWLQHLTSEYYLRKREKSGNFSISLVPCSLVGLRSRRKIHLFRGRKTDESLRRNIIMAKSARSTQNCSVASGAGAIPRIHAEKGRQAKGCTVYRGLPDSHRAPPENDFAPQGRTGRDRSGSAGVGSIRWPIAEETETTRSTFHVRSRCSKLAAFSQPAGY